MFASSAAMEPLLGNKAAAFDATNFSWIGSMSQDVAYCGVWQTPGAAASFDEMMTKETIFGGGGAAAITTQHPLIMKNILGANIRLILGYPGTRDINLAMHRGEVNGTCGMFASPSRRNSWTTRGVAVSKLVYPDGRQEIRRIRQLPSVFDYAKTDDDQAVLDLHFKAAPARTSLAGPPGFRRSG